jgi:hypothetical protein
MVLSDSGLNPAGADELVAGDGSPAPLVPFPQAVTAPRATSAMTANPATDLREVGFTFAEASSSVRMM